jgi:Putative lumazine-binding
MAAVDISDVAAVRAVVERYVDATYRADIEQLRGTFHPGAAMAGYLGDDLLVGTPEPFFADMGSRPSMAGTDVAFKAEITSIQVAGRTAAVTLEEDGLFGAFRFVNFFHLLKIDGEWQLVSKTFASL